MQIAILLYHRFTALDAVGPYEVLCRVPQAEVVFVGAQPGPITNDVDSLRLIADAALADVLSPQIVLVPGGPGQADQMVDGPVHEWLRAVDVEPTGERVVFDGKYVTAAGVSAGIDMALALAGRIAGDGVGQVIQLGIEYDPASPAARSRLIPRRRRVTRARARIVRVSSTSMRTPLFADVLGARSGKYRAA